MRRDDVARGVAEREPLEGDIEDAPLVSVEPADESLLLPVLGVVLGAGGVRLTSPPEVFVTVPLEDAALLRTQSVVIVELDAVPLVDADMPLVVDADVPVADVRAAAESAAESGGVVPVPLAPFVLFRPVNR